MGHLGLHEGKSMVDTLESFWKEDDEWDAAIPVCNGYRKDSGQLKYEKPCSQITFLAGQLHLLLQDSCGVDSRLGSRSRSYWCCVTDGAGDRPCPAQGAWYTCKGMKGGSSRNLD